MSAEENNKLGKTLWSIADQLRGAMDADDFRDYMLVFLFLRYLSDNYEEAAQRELGADYPLVLEGDRRIPLAVWYDEHPDDVRLFETQMRAKVHYVIKPEHLWTSIANMARRQDADLLKSLQAAFKHIEEESFDANFQGLFSEISLTSDKLGRAKLP
ncbi:MAG: type I restriction-modification system subunit M N-terminal domain-containing protein [Fimbriimonadales bacterium]